MEMEARKWGTFKRANGRYMTNLGIQTSAVRTGTVYNVVDLALAVGSARICISMWASH